MMGGILFKRGTGTASIVCISFCSIVQRNFRAIQTYRTPVGFCEKLNKISRDKPLTLRRLLLAIDVGGSFDENVERNATFFMTTTELNVILYKCL